jgi:hypothetical protein
VSRNGHDDIATRLRREASAAAPERLRADVMLRVRAEPRPQRIRPRRSFGRSLATVAAAACILGALVFGLSRVDFGGGSSGSGAGGGLTAAGEKLAPAQGALGGKAGTAQDVEGATYPLDRDANRKVAIISSVPGPLRGAIYGRAHLAAPLQKTFGALDPYHLRTRP